MLLKFTVVVEVPQPDYMKKKEFIATVKAYIADAVGSLKGSFRPPGAEGPDNPGDPMWDLEVRLVRQRRLGG